MHRLIEIVIAAVGAWIATRIPWWAAAIYGVSLTFWLSFGSLLFGIVVGMASRSDFRERHLPRIQNLTEIMAALLGLVASILYNRSLAIPALVVCVAHIYFMRASRRALGMK